MTQPTPSLEEADMSQTCREIVRQTFEIWQQVAAHYMMPLLRNQSLLALNGRAIENTLQFKQQSDHLVEATLTNLQLPTRSDLDNVLQKLTEVETLLRDLHEKVDQLAAQQTSV